MTELLVLLAVLAALVALAWWVLDAWLLQGADLEAWDTPIPEGAHQRMNPGMLPSPEHAAVVERIGNEFVEAAGLSGRRRLAWIRNKLEQPGREQHFDCAFMPVDENGVRGEWVIAPGVDRTRRAYYIHGGAFVAGSPLGHRPITTRLSRAANAPVFSLDYRLMPEHSRVAGIEDCRRAYRWVLANGPDGPAPAQVLFAGGDSAGGNLVLSLAAWVRDTGLQPPTAVFAFSPGVDSTLLAPSIRANMDSDEMLGRLFRPLLKVPPRLLRLSWLAQNRMRPVNPAVSPIFADLSGLSPLLVQASESEILWDDARRYVHKARASGTDARLQSWQGLLHVWQIFQPEVPEANHAWSEVEKWLQSFQATSSPS